MSHGVSPDSIRTVLVVKPSSLGDIVHTLPSVHLLKRAYPHLKISWTINPEWAPLLAGNPDLDAIIHFPRGDFRFPPNLPSLRDWLVETTRVKPDLALDFQGLLRSALIARISGARSIHCLGNATPACRFLSHRVIPAARGGEHAVARYLKMVADLGIDTGVPLEFPLPAGEKPADVEIPARYLLLHPFARGGNKSLTDACLARLVQMLSPAPIVLAGRTSPDYSPPPGCINLLNKTSLSGLIWLIRNARFTVSVDSGPMHIAAAITDRLLGIYNWTNPLLVGPYNPGAWIWKDGSLLQMRDLAQGNTSGSRSFGPEDAGQVAEFLGDKF